MVARDVCASEPLRVPTYITEDIEGRFTACWKCGGVRDTP